jgi:2'-5' RNA ligase
LFLRAEETPALLEANQEARTIFHHQQDAKFLPHLSLMYGNFDIEAKTRFLASIGREFNKTFSVDQIHLFFTSGEPKDWYRVQKYELQSR